MLSNDERDEKIEKINEALTWVSSYLEKDSQLFAARNLSVRVQESPLLKLVREARAALTELQIDEK